MTNRKPAAEMSRDELLALVRAFVRSRPGFEPMNYATGTDYRRDVREATRDMNDALTMLRLIDARDVIDADTIRSALQGSGRLRLDDDGRLDYIAGQYYCVEFRAAVARFAASLLWNYFSREAEMDASERGVELDWTARAYAIRKKARQEFGRGLASRWFR